MSSSLWIPVHPYSFITRQVADALTVNPDDNSVLASAYGVRHVFHIADAYHTFAQVNILCADWMHKAAARLYVDYSNTCSDDPHAVRVEVHANRQSTLG